MHRLGSQAPTGEMPCPAPRSGDEELGRGMCRLANCSGPSAARHMLRSQKLQQALELQRAFGAHIARGFRSRDPCGKLLSRHVEHGEHQSGTAGAEKQSGLGPLLCLRLCWQSRSLLGLHSMSKHGQPMPCAQSPKARPAPPSRPQSHPRIRFRVHALAWHLDRLRGFLNNSAEPCTNRKSKLSLKDSRQAMTHLRRDFLPRAPGAERTTHRRKACLRHFLSEFSSSEYCLRKLLKGQGHPTSR